MEKQIYDYTNSYVQEELIKLGINNLHDGVKYFGELSDYLNFTNKIRFSHINGQMIINMLFHCEQRIIDLLVDFNARHNDTLFHQ